MSDEEVLKYLANQSRSVVPKTRKQILRQQPGRKPEARAQETFKDFSASHLYCPKCRQAMPVKEKLLLYLPTGNLFDYCCERCGTSVGTRKTGIY